MKLSPFALPVAVTIASLTAPNLHAGPAPDVVAQPPAGSIAPTIRHGLDAERTARANAMIAKAEAYLRGKQDPATGAWSVRPGAPVFPAITALVVHGMAMDPNRAAPDESLRKGIDYLLASQKPTGGIYDALLPSYNTAISVSALARVRDQFNDPRAAAAITKALPFLRSLQWGEDAQPDANLAEQAQKVGREHAFYGGVGYGRSGRPDLSNLSWYIEAFNDAGVEKDDPALQRALVFLSRVQMHEKINDQAYAKGSTQGGFIYATNDATLKTAEGKVEDARGQSFAGTFEETLSDGTVASRLRCYGSMTYAGFKSLIHAGLSREDERVVMALRWIGANYTLAENPGIGTDGLYYYFVTFARALEAHGAPMITLPTGAAANWRSDLVDRLEQLQLPDGSFWIQDDRWMENDPVLITAYGLIAVGEAMR